MSDPTMKTSSPEPEPKPKKPRGFALLDPALIRALARKGGVSAHQKGSAHEFSREEARAAGRKGGLATGKNSPARENFLDTEEA